MKIKENILKTYVPFDKDEDDNTQEILEKFHYDSHFLDCDNIMRFYRGGTPRGVHMEWLTYGLHIRHVICFPRHLTCIWHPYVHAKE